MRKQVSASVPLPIGGPMRVQRARSTYLYPLSLRVSPVFHNDLDSIAFVLLFHLWYVGRYCEWRSNTIIAIVSNSPGVMACYHTAV